MPEISPASEARPAQVRLALPSEVETIAALQRRCWDHDQPEGLRDWLLTNLDLAAVTEGWHQAVNRPPDARCRVLIALAGTDEGDVVVSDEQGAPGGGIVGFVTTQPAGDPDAVDAEDGEVAEWLIDPAARGRGHGSRLLNAAVDTLRADGFNRATTWVASTDDGRRRLLTGAGWDVDGAHRTIGPEESLGVKQVRLHTNITDDPDDSAR